MIELSLAKGTVGRKLGAALPFIFWAAFVMAAVQDANVAGAWDITLQTGQGTANPSMLLTQEGERITGTYQGRFGESKLAGTLKGNAIRFSITVKFRDEPVTVGYSGTVEGESMKGTVQFGDRGSGSWTAKRK